MAEMTPFPIPFYSTSDRYDSESITDLSCQLIFGIKPDKRKNKTFKNYMPIL